MADLHIPLKGEYFDLIDSGSKVEEYRETTPYWRKRLIGRSYDGLVLTRGYPSRDDNSRRLRLPYRGYEVKTISHPQFGSKPVEVFAINVNRNEVLHVAQAAEINRLRGYLQQIETATSTADGLSPENTICLNMLAGLALREAAPGDGA